SVNITPRAAIYRARTTQAKGYALRQGHNRPLYAPIAVHSTQQSDYDRKRTDSTSPWSNTAEFRTSQTSWGQHDRVGNPYCRIRRSLPISHTGRCTESGAISKPPGEGEVVAVFLKGTSNNTRFQRFLSWLSGRLQRSCRGESPIGDRFDAWPASVLCTMPHT